MNFPRPRRPLELQFSPVFSAILTSYEFRKKNQTEEVETA
jgi:hypothetical protein